MPHATTLANRLITALEGIDVSTGDSVNILSVRRFSRTEGAPKDLPAIRVQTFDQGNAAQGGDEEVGTVVKSHTFLVDCFYARDSVDQARTDELDEAIGADVEAVANALDVDNTFAGKLGFRRWTPFHNLDRDAADFGIRAELVAVWRQDKNDSTVIT